MLRALITVLTLLLLPACGGVLTSEGGAWTWTAVDPGGTGAPDPNWWGVQAGNLLEGTQLCGLPQHDDLSSYDGDPQNCYALIPTGDVVLDEWDGMACLRFQSQGDVRLEVSPQPCGLLPPIELDADHWDFEVVDVGAVLARPMTVPRMLAWSHADEDRTEDLVAEQLRVVASAPITLRKGLLRLDREGLVAWPADEATMELRDAVDVALAPEVDDENILIASAGGTAKLIYSAPEDEFDAGTVLGVPVSDIASVEARSFDELDMDSVGAGALAFDADGNPVWGGRWTWEQLDGPEILVVGLLAPGPGQPVVNKIGDCTPPELEESEESALFRVTLGDASTTVTMSWTREAGTPALIDGFLPSEGCSEHVPEPLDPTRIEVEITPGCTNGTRLTLGLPFFGLLGRRRLRKGTVR